MRKTPRVRLLITALAAVFLAGSLRPAFGQDESLKKALAAGWRMWRDIQADLSTLTFTIGAGYAGDTSTNKELHKLDINADVAKSGYPNDLRFDLSSNIQLKRTNSRTDFIENVTTLRLNYERYFLPFLKAYGFVERFTDTYLSIQQRYETGVGVKAEVQFGITPAGRKRLENLENLRQTAAEGRAKGVEGGEDVTQALGIGEDQFRDTAIAIQKKYAVLSLGLACTTLVELERAELELPDGTKRLVDPNRRFRLALRPSLNFQPDEGLSLKWQTYFKLPVFGETEALAFNGNLVYDYRTDTYVTLRYDLPKAPAWARRISLLIEYKYFFDNAPPFLARVLLAAHDHNSLVFKVSADF